jgi:PKD domain
MKVRLAGFIALVLTGLVSATVAAPIAAASEVSSVPVIAWVYGTSGRTMGGQTTIGALESGTSGCPINTPAASPPQYGPGGSTIPASQSPTNEQWAVLTLLTDPNCFGIPLASINQVSVLTSSGLPQANPSAILQQSDLTAPNGPLIWDAGSTVGYVRPSRGPTDDNFADGLTFGPGDSVVFDVYVDGTAPAKLSVSASPTTAATNAPVTFSVQNQGQPLPSGETYTWDFAGGNTTNSSSPTPNASFPQPGVYTVTVQVSGSVNGSGTLQITIGSPRPVTTSTKTTATGPAKSKGKTPGGTPSKKPKPGPAVNPKPKPKPKAKPKPKPKAAKKIPAKKQTQQLPTMTSTSAASPPSTPSSGGGTNGGGNGGGTAGSSPSTGSGTAKAPPHPASPVHVTVIVKHHHHHPTTAPKPPVQLKRHPPVISGRTLGTVEPLTGSTQKLVQDLTHGGSAPPLSQPSGKAPWALVAAILAIGALLGLGAGNELRHVRSDP